MNKITKILFLIFTVVFLASCSKGGKKLEFAVLDSTYKIGSDIFNADYCKMQVLENPLDKSSKVIDIPVIRIRTKSKQPAAPIFFLNDGPGLSNFVKIMPTWLALNHDVVIVGYRGVDGSVNLDIPELRQIAQNPNFLSEQNLDKAASAFSSGLKTLEKKLDIDINQYNINNIAYDVESARAAFNYPKINLFAVGYGARIAQIYSKIAPEFVFRVLLERPKPYGTLALKPDDIGFSLGFFDDESIKINNGITYSENIIKGLEKLPTEDSGFFFDKDKIVTASYLYMESIQGPAGIYEAFSSAQKGDYEGIKYIQEQFPNLFPNFNISDYLVKAASCEFESGNNYSKEFTYNSQYPFGSPIAKFIYGTLQKSSYKPNLLDKSLVHPDSIKVAALIYSINLDLNAPMTYSDFVMGKVFRHYDFVGSSHYNLRTFHKELVEDYSKLIRDYFYKGDLVFYGKSRDINLIPEKTFKQLAIEKQKM